MSFVIPSYGLPSIHPSLGRRYAWQRKKVVMDCTIFELGIQPYCPSLCGISSGRRILFRCHGFIINTSNTPICGSRKLRHPTTPSSRDCIRFGSTSGKLPVLSSMLPTYWIVGLTLSCDVELLPCTTSSSHGALRRRGQQLCGSGTSCRSTNSLFGSLQTVGCRQKISYRMKLA